MRRPWIAVGWSAAAAHTAASLRLSGPEVAASAGLAWGVFLVALSDLGEPDGAVSRPRAALAAFACTSAALILATLVFGTHAARAGPVPAFVVRALPLWFGLGLLAWAARGFGRSLWPLLALLCPLVTPVPVWLRERLPDPSAASAWGAERLLLLIGCPVDRSGVLLLFPHGELQVNSECSGLGAVLQLLVIVALLWVALRPPARVIARLVPLAVAIGLALNFARLALLGWLLERGGLESFTYWHEGPGSRLYSILSALLLLAFALPLVAAGQRTRGPQFSV